MRSVLQTSCLPGDILDCERLLTKHLSLPGPKRQKYEVVVHPKPPDCAERHGQVRRRLNQSLQACAGNPHSKKTPFWEHNNSPGSACAYLLVGLTKVKEMSWFQKGSFSDMDSVPTRVLRLWLLARSLMWLVLAPISAPSSQTHTPHFTPFSQGI